MLLKLLRHWRNPRVRSKHVSMWRIWHQHLLLSLRLHHIWHIISLGHVMSTPHLGTTTAVTSYYASWCFRLVHNYLLLRINHVDIGSVNSSCTQVVLRRVLLVRYRKVKGREVWYKLSFELCRVELFDIFLLTMHIALLLRRCFGFRNMEGWKIDTSEKIVGLCRSGYLLLGLWLWLNSFWGGIIPKEIKCVI